MRKGIRLKPQRDWGISTNAPGLALISGQSSLSRQEQETEAQIKSVVAAQPHRRGDDTPEAGSALGRLCRASELEVVCFHAGTMYGDMFRRWRQAEGYRVHGYAFGTLGEPISPETRELYREKMRNADDVVIRIDHRAPRLLQDLCYEDKDLPIERHSMIGGCLFLLAVHFGMRKLYHDIDGG